LCFARQRFCTAIFAKMFHAKKVRLTCAKCASIVGGSGGILPRKIFEPRISQMPFLALWREDFAEF
jgi:hypothetical protein